VEDRAEIRVGVWRIVCRSTVLYTDRLLVFIGSLGGSGQAGGCTVSL
jgi:hypothetical protein